MEDKENTRHKDAHLSEPQKAHLTDEFLVVMKWWLWTALFEFYACDCGQ